MIGMMYLVLTAMLALNVSKEILDAFINIEENMQRSNETEISIGNERRKDLEIVARDESIPEKAARARKVLTVVEEIDRITALQIAKIDELKLAVLRASGEAIDIIGADQIVTSKRKKGSLLPISLNLQAIKRQDDYDAPMEVLIGNDLKNPKGKGLEMWNAQLKYRSDVIRLISHYTSIDGSEEYSFQPPDIRQFSDDNELRKQVEKSMAKGNVNPEDKETILELYSLMSKNERVTLRDVRGVHWLGKTFDHSPLVAAIASLTALQNDVLAARAAAVTLLFGRVGGGEYTFNKIIALAYGPEWVASGESIDVDVLMAAYDSDIQPKVRYNGKLVTEVEGGKGHLRLQASQPGSMLLNGTISITNKYGMEKTLPWEKRINVMQPMGAISIPAFNLLYLGKENELKATVSGYEETVLEGTHVDLFKRNQFWIAKPHKGQRSCTIRIFGRSKSSQQKVLLGSQEYRISRLPSPDLYLGASTDGGVIPTGIKQLFLRYEPGIPLQPEFTILDWSLEALGKSLAPIAGTGAELNTEAMKLVQMAPAGQRFLLSARIIDNTATISTVRATLKK